jgi:hypothetical protein
VQDPLKFRRNKLQRSPQVKNKLKNLSSNLLQELKAPHSLSVQVRKIIRLTLHNKNFNVGTTFVVEEKFEYIK